MTKKTRSAKGNIVDWDLLKVKQSIASGPTPVNVEERELFIDQKLRRKVTRRKAQPPVVETKVEPQILNEDETDEETAIESTESTKESSSKKKTRKINKT